MSDGDRWQLETKQEKKEKEKKKKDRKKKKKKMETELRKRQQSLISLLPLYILSLDYKIYEVISRGDVFLVEFTLEDSG